MKITKKITIAFIIFFLHFSFFLYFLNPKIFAQETNAVDISAGSETLTQPTSLSQEVPKKTYKLLAPLPIIGEEIEVGGPEGIAKYISTIFRFLIGIIGLLAVLVLIYAGVQYMTTEAFAKKEVAKKYIQGAILGLLLALSSVLLLETIDPTLVKLEFFLPRMRIDPIDDTLPQDPINGFYCKNTEGTKGGFPANKNWIDALIEKGLPSDIPKIIESKKINVSFNYPGNFFQTGGNCNYVGQKNCTSIRGLKPEIIDAILKMCEKYNNFPNEIVITAGTECWLHGRSTHNTPHIAGKPTIDLRVEGKLTYCLSGGISNNFQDPNIYNKWFKYEVKNLYRKGKNYTFYCWAEPKSKTSDADHWHCQQSGPRKSKISKEIEISI